MTCPITWATGRSQGQPCRWLGNKPVRYLLSDIEEFEDKNR